MESQACGEIGLSIDEFYSLTPAQFYNISTGYFNKVKRETEKSWMQTKVISWMIYNTIPTDKKTKKLGFEEFSNSFFNNDEKLEITPDLNKEEQIERANKMFKKIDKLNLKTDDNGQ